MFIIKFIDNLFFRDSNLRAEGREGTTTNVFLRQGQLDRACGIYGLLMLLIIHKRINGNDLTDEIAHDDPQYIKRLKKLFLNPLKGIKSDGTTMSYLRGMLLRIFDDQINVSVFKKLDTGEDNLLHFRIRNHLDAGYPVLIAYRKPDAFGHVVLVIGYTMLGDIMRLYCLDPSGSAPWFNYWNNMIDIKISDDEEDWPDFNHWTGKKVKVDKILIIEDDKCMELFSPFNDTALPF